MCYHHNGAEHVHSVFSSDAFANRVQYDATLRAKLLGTIPAAVTAIATEAEGAISFDEKKKVVCRAIAAVYREKTGVLHFLFSGICLTRT